MLFYASQRFEKLSRVCVDGTSLLIQIDPQTYIETICFFILLY